jgi:hypothetical protein
MGQCTRKREEKGEDWEALNYGLIKIVGKEPDFVNNNTYRIIPKKVELPLDRKGKNI